LYKGILHFFSLLQETAPFLDIFTMRPSFLFILDKEFYISFHFWDEIFDSFSLLQRNLSFL
jgi:hypothetical protein